MPIDGKFLYNFVRISEKVIGKKGDVTLELEPDKIKLYCKNEEFSVFGSTAAQNQVSTVISISLEKFISLIKKFKNETISIYPNKSKLLFQVNNSKVEFSKSGGAEKFELGEYTRIENMSLLPYFFKCSDMVDFKTSGYGGILVDFSEVGHIVGFGNFEIRISAFEGLQFNKRCVVKSDLSKIYKLFPKEVLGILVSNERFGLQIGQISVFCNLLEDNYPHEYLGLFNLDAQATVVGSREHSFRFDKNFLKESVEVALTVSGTDSPNIYFELVGEDKDNNPIWTIKSESGGGSTFKENLRSVSNFSDFFYYKFSVNGKKFVKAISSYTEDDIFIYPFKLDSVVLISDKHCDDVTILPKVFA